MVGSFNEFTGIAGGSMLKMNLAANILIFLFLEYLNLMLNPIKRNLFPQSMSTFKQQNIKQELVKFFSKFSIFLNIFND